VLPRAAAPCPHNHRLGDSGTIVFEPTPDEFVRVTFCSSLLPVSRSRANCARERRDSADISRLLIAWSRAS
jgi:hypothetical protein